MDYIDKIYRQAQDPQLWDSMSDDELDKLQDRVPASAPSNPNVILKALQFDPKKPLDENATPDQLDAAFAAKHQSEGEPKPIVIEGTEPTLQIESSRPGGAYKSVAAESHRQNVNELLPKLDQNRDQAYQDLVTERARMAQGKSDAQGAIDQLKNSLPTYKPSMDYTGEMQKLRDQNDAIKDPERDLLSQAIVSLGPSLVGMFTGSAGMAAAAPATAQAQTMYDKQMLEAKAHNAILRKNISDRVAALASAQKNDITRYTDTQRLELDKAKAVADQSTKIGNNKEDIIQANFNLREADKALKDAFTSGSAKASDIEQSDLNSQRNAQAAQQRIAKGSTSQDLARERLADIAWNRNMGDTVKRVEAGGRVQGLIDAIRDGSLTDSGSVRNTLSQDLYVLTLPSGMRGTQSGQEKVAIDNLNTAKNDILAWIKSKPVSTIPPEYLDQFEKESKILTEKYGGNMKTRYNTMLSTKDPSLKDMYTQKYQETMTGNHLDPETGKMMVKEPANKVEMTREEKIKAIKAARGE